jgi:bifunctional ADP-heptose synthase (sugar kinase/adenylyltransferase)
MVDFVCTFDEDTPLETILTIRPDVLVKGADWTAKIVVRAKSKAGAARLKRCLLSPGSQQPG